MPEGNVVLKRERCWRWARKKLRVVQHASARGLALFRDWGFTLTSKGGWGRWTLSFRWQGKIGGRGS